MLHAINKLVINPEHGQNSLPISLKDRGSTSSSGKHAYTHMHNTPHKYNKPSRPTMPHFLENATIGPIIPTEPSELFGAYLQEYRVLGDEFHSIMSFSDFCNMKNKNQPRKINIGFT